MSTGFEDIVLCGGFRTPFGDFGKSLREVPLSTMGVHATRATLRHLDLDPARIDHLVFGIVGVVDHDGPFISRKVALNSGLPIESAALTVTRACGSGVQSLVSAAEQIVTGHSQIAVAAGGENFSRAPYVNTTQRYGAQRGPVTLEDGLDFIYRCPFSRDLMGDTAETLAEQYGYDRAAMDELGYLSQMRAKAAAETGFLARQIDPIEVPAPKGQTRLFSEDEFPRPSVTREKLAQLRPAFKPDGVVTAGNASGVTDGAAAIVVARTGALPGHVQPRARLVDYAVAGVPPEIMGAGPVPAIEKLLQQQSLRVDDIDYFEINEAFAVVVLHAEKMLNIPRDRLNLYGGGISIGHPPGATGLRMAQCAMQHLEDTGTRRAIISMCLGSGMGMAALIERIP
jgi:acetyl-CoA acetyltransferase family protein